MLKRAAALFCVCVSLACWVSCGKNVNRYVYASLPATNQILTYREDPNAGVLTALVGSPFTAGPAVQSIVLHPSGKFLYAANSAESDVSLFTVSAGALTEVTPRTPTGTSPMLLAMDSTGSFLYVASTFSQSISTFSINATTGALTAQGVALGIGMVPLDMKLAPSGNFMYVSGVGAPGFIEVIALSSGIPTLPLVQVVQPGQSPYGMVIDPSGTHLYAANPAPDNSIAEFTIDSTTGMLQALSGSPVAETFSSPIALFIDKSGKFLYVANQGSNNLAGYAIGTDGGLTLLASSPFTTSANPRFITSDPVGNFLFVGNQAQSNATVQSFSMDPNSGSLVSVAAYNVGTTPSSIAVSH